MRLVVCRRVDWVVILLSLWLPCCVNHECRSLLFDGVRFLIGVFVYVCCLFVGCVPTLVVDYHVVRVCHMLLSA